METTVRDASLRDYEIYVLQDCVASFQEEVTARSLAQMADMATVLSREEFFQSFI
ncbi:MAG: isochorismatase family protein [Bacilli bacterium]